MLQKILIGLGVVVLGFVGLVATRPAEFAVERSIGIAAPPEIPYALVNDLHNFNLWSPWDQKDPQMKRTFEGSASGVGAVYGWSGNKDVGTGKMTIVESKPAELVAMKLDFIEPMTATNQTVWTFKPIASGTQVTWSMQGHNNFAGKAFALFMDMDKMIGSDFETGLANMKKVSEDRAAKAAAAAAATAAAAAAAPPAPEGTPASGGSGEPPKKLED